MNATKRSDLPGDPHASLNGTHGVFLVTNFREGQSLLSKRFASVPGHLYASPQYLARHAAPKSLAELAGHEHVLFRGKNGPGKLKLRGDDGATSLTVSGRFSANDFVVVREAVLGGAGIGPLPWFVARAAE